LATTQEERLLTVAEAARRLDVSPSTVWRWIDARRLPAVRVGMRKIRIRSADVEAMVTPARRAQPEPSAVTRHDLEAGPSAEELARRRQLYEELMEYRRNLPPEWMTATEAMAISDAMQLEHDERLAGIRR
jgi:excisionase family DNA binding protein